RHHRSDELLEEIFLRLPPDEPEHLVRASLASKLWLGLLCGPRFRGRYHDYHGAPPMLGFLHTWLESWEDQGPVPHLTSTTKFGARIPDHERDYSPLDCRHGRVLLGDDVNQIPMALVVWDPMTGRRRELEAPGLVVDSHRAAVLCTVGGCDHRACHEGPFQVVFVCVGSKGDEDDDCVAYACVSLPETGDWSEPCPLFDPWGEPCPALLLPAETFFEPMPPVLIEEAALHFMLEVVDDDSVGILKYDLSSHSLSLIDAPIEGSQIATASILMAMEDGSLGFAHVSESTLYLWSRLMDSDGVASWSQRTIINLRNLPIQNPEESLRLVGSVEGRDVVFVTTELSIYGINVESQRWKKLWKRKKLHALIPYMSFYTIQKAATLIKKKDGKLGGDKGVVMNKLAERIIL
uniref:Uncharacterized protein n=1 Tax=Aegilops tauschii subsp. strangulata TaxID=200361 RepID=A0A453MFD4_AEGTS